MATRKKTSVSKTAEAKKSVAEVNEEVITEETAIVEDADSEVEPEVVEEPEVAPAKKKKGFAQTDGIECRSVTPGIMFMDGEKTGISYSWSSYGDVSYVEYRDLAAAVRSKSSYIFNPFIIVDDEDFVAEFPQLKSFYDDKYSVKDLKKILEMDVSAMLEAIKVLPKGAIESLKMLASTSIQSGELDSMRKIKALDEALGTQLSIYVD